MDSTFLMTDNLIQNQNNVTQKFSLFEFHGQLLNEINFERSFRYRKYQLKIIFYLLNYYKYFVLKALTMYHFLIK